MTTLADATTTSAPANPVAAEDVKKIGITEAKEVLLRGPGFAFWKDGPPDPRKLANDEYIVEVDFGIEKGSLGLILDWSMALPVVAGVVPRRPAASKANLTPGLVLVAVNGRGLLTGRPRSEVEDFLAARPLKCVFESAAAGRFGEVWQQPWQCTGPANAPPSKNDLLYRTGKKWPLQPERVKMLRGELEPVDPIATVSSFLCKSAGSTYFDDHPERSPLTRYGNLDTAPMYPGQSQALALANKSNNSGGWSGRPMDQTMHSTKLPNITNGGFSHMGSTHARSEPSLFAVSKPQGFGNTGFSGGRAGSRKSTANPGEGALHKQNSIDPCYQLLVAAYAEEAQGSQPFDFHHAKRARRGGGATPKWELMHDENYPCTLADMKLAHKVRDAYEVGFAGWKTERPTQVHILMYKAAPPRLKTVITLEEGPIWCDMCGDDVTTADNNGRFWYCRRCKRNGRRHEVCMACHAVEVLQGEGKHGGTGPHPHYLRHEHRQIFVQPDLRVAYPYSPHLRRVFCDHCGEHVDFTDEESVLYLCPQCPEEHGLRFELCERCALSLRDSGNGFRYAREAAGF